MQYFLVIDQGTTSTRAIIFAADGRKCGVGRQRIQQHYPQSGWVEHSAEEIWQAVVTTGQQALQQAKLTASDITAIGITNQRETTVLWDKNTAEPVANAIVWQDRRTAQYCQALASDRTLAQTVAQRTGLLFDPYFSASKIHWLLENVKGLRARAERGEILFGTIDAFLLWRLTEGRVHATDATNASRTLLFDIHTQQWDEELLKIFAIPTSMLPQVWDNCADFGVTNVFGEAIPITAMIGDQQSALVGQACIHKNDLKCTYGTGGFLLMNTADQCIHTKHRLLSTVAYRLQGKVTYACEGSIFAAASTLNWLRDNLHLLANAKDSETIAQSLENNGEVYLIPAFAGLGAPHWQPQARAAIVGLSYATTSAHIVRAGLESVAYQTRDLIAAMIADGASKPNIMRVDGGMAKNAWLLQFIADVLNVQVARSTSIETTAWGAALLAGLHTNVFSSLAEIASNWQAQRYFEPTQDRKAVEAMYGGWQQALAYFF